VTSAVYHVVGVFYFLALPFCFISLPIFRCHLYFEQLYCTILFVKSMCPLMTLAPLSFTNSLKWMQLVFLSTTSHPSFLSLFCITSCYFFTTLKAFLCFLCSASRGAVEVFPPHIILKQWVRNIMAEQHLITIFFTTAQQP
jgi:hypothetical protein